LVPARLRARAVGFTIAGAESVSDIATVVVWATEKLNDRRQYMVPLAIQAAGPSVLLFLTLLLTESPIWLLKKGRLDEANVNLALLRTDNSMLVAAELSAALVSLQPNEEMTSNMKATLSESWIPFKLVPSWRAEPHPNILDHNPCSERRCKPVQDHQHHIPPTISWLACWTNSYQQGWQTTGCTDCVRYSLYH
jgi:hypothetical protein